MAGFIMVLIVLTILMVLMALLTWNQQILTRAQLKEFSLTNDQKINVQYTLSSLGILTTVAAFPMKADMYVKDNFLLITPRGNTLQDWLNVGHLPVLFAMDADAVKNELNSTISSDLTLYPCQIPAV